MPINPVFACATHAAAGPGDPVQTSSVRETVYRPDFSVTPIQSGPNKTGCVAGSHPGTDTTLSTDRVTPPKGRRAKPQQEIVHLRGSSCSEHLIATA